MAVKHNKKTRSRRQRFIQAVKGGPLRMRERSHAATPAPTDNGAAAHSPGVLRFDSDGSRLPKGLAEVGETEPNGLMPGPVVLVIAILAIIFISIMAWFVSQMPEK
jgi:hypothetical protein